MTKIAIIKDAGALNKAIASINNRGIKLDADIHVAGVSVLAHAMQHGDVTLCDKLYAAMPKGSRRNALVSWMLAYGPVELLAKDKAKDGRMFALNRDSKTFDEVGACAESWVEHKPEAAPQDVFDLQKATAALLARYTKAKEAGIKVTDADAATRKHLAEVFGLQLAE